MYNVLKRDGEMVRFDISKIANAMKKAFEATNTEYTDNIIDFLALKVTADYLPKIQDGLIKVEDIQDVFIRFKTDSSKQCSYRQFLLTVYVSVHYVVYIGGELNPRTFERNNSG